METDGSGGVAIVFSEPAPAAASEPEPAEPAAEPAPEASDEFSGSQGTEYWVTMFNSMVGGIGNVVAIMTPCAALRLCKFYSIIFINWRIGEFDSAASCVESGHCVRALSVCLPA